MDKKTLHMVTYFLTVVGALNWGLIGLSGFNLVNAVLASVPSAERVVYVLVGLSAIAMLFMCKCSKCCGDKGGECCKEGAAHM